MANQSICSVECCGKSSNTKGLCRAHYWRLWKYGDPLAGATPKGAARRFIHEVASPYSGNDCLIWPFATNPYGYGVYTRPERGITLASRYVCEIVHGAAPTPQHEAAHSCGNGHKGCVNPNHLSWKTPKDNTADKFRHGTVARGEQIVASKLTEAQVKEIRSLKGVKNQYELAEQFGVRQQTISRIHSRARWAWL